MDLYAILGVTRDCSEDEIKKAYRKLAKIHHPDKHVAEPEVDRKLAEDKFKAINHAYEILSKPEKRQRYDAQMEIETFWSILCDIFNPFQPVLDWIKITLESLCAVPSLVWSWSISTPQPRNKNNPVFVDLSVSLEDLYHGATIKVSHSRMNHKNQTTETKDLSIEVKPGWKEGTKITFSDLGDITDNDSDPSDVIYMVKQIPHDRFKRVDNDLITILDLSLSEAQLGFERNIRGIDDNTITISIKNGISDSNDIFRIIGKGMGIRRKGNFIGYGDLLVKFNVNLRSNQSETVCLIGSETDSISLPFTFSKNFNG